MRKPLLLLLGMLIAAPASAAQIDLSLNLIYDAPFNPNSGGTWQVVARSDSFGVASLGFRLTGRRAASSQFVAPQGVVNGGDTAGFIASVRNFSAPPTGNTDYLVERNPSIAPGGETGVFYGVGTIAGGAPGDIGPAYSTLIGTTHIPWATGDVFNEPNWNTAATFFTGVFAPGDAPNFLIAPGIDPFGTVYLSLDGATPTTVGLASQPASTTITTTVRNNVQGVAGDYNQDGQVDAADYSAWRNALGQSASPRGAGADGNADGQVNGADYLVWRQHYGQVFPSAPGAAFNAVPEPGSLAGLIGVLLAACGFPRRGRFLPGF
jgi:hypothetical protein